jgi:hypothetical protein
MIDELVLTKLQSFLTDIRTIIRRESHWQSRVLRSDRR